MKVLIIHTILWSHYKAALFNELAHQAGGDELLVVHFARNQGKYQQLSQSEAAYHRYPHQVLSQKLIEELGLAEKAKGLIRIINRFRPDIINLTGYYEPVYWLLMALYAPRGVRFIISNESGLSDQQRVGWKEQFKRLIVGRARGFFCFGKTSADYLLTLGVRPQQILTRHAAVLDNARIEAVAAAAFPAKNAEKQRLGLPENILVFAGRLSPEKNLIAFLNAFRAVRKTLTAEWGLVLLGDGPLRQALLEDFADVVHWHPPVAWHEVPSVLALADALVLPSLSEPWGLVVNEAMLCGLPVLASARCGCVPDLVHEGRNGFIFEPTDEAAMQQAIRKMLLLTDAERHAMGVVSRKIIADFNPQRAAAEMWAGYRKVHHENP